MDHKKIQAPVALITGSARRIGAEIAKTLHQAGYRIVIHYLHSQQEATDITRLINKKQKDRAIMLAADLCDETATVQLIHQTINWAGRLDLLVNNASLFKKTDISKNSNLDWNELFTVNVHAPFWLSQAAYPYLAKHHGSIINITDIHADKPLKEYGIYCQTKAALAMQTKVLAREFAPQVRVNAIAPGAIAWPEGTNSLAVAQQQKIIAKTPLKKHGNPQYIAQAVVFFAENSFITGQILQVDGGRSLI